MPDLCPQVMPVPEIRVQETLGAEAIEEIPPECNEIPLCGSKIHWLYARNGSEAPVRDHRMQPFDAETAETFGRPRERLLPPSRLFSAAPANVKFQGSPVAR